MIKLLSKLIPDSVKQEFKIKLGAPHMYWSINNLKRNGLKPTHIIDIGAYKGEWTYDVMKIFPDASYLLIEANPEREKDLRDFIANHPKSRIEVEMALLDSHSGTEKTFHLLETASSALDEFTDQHSKNVSLPTRTLNDVASLHHFKEASLMKLDVQGYELEILKGGSELLANCQAVLMEVSLMDIHKNVPLLHDVVNFMYQYDYVAYDICSLAARRPLDKALWQTDILFVKTNSIFRQNKSYY